MATCLPSRKLSKLDEPDTAGEAVTRSSVIYSYGSPHMAEQKQDDQLEHTYSSYVRIRDVALKICQSRWTIGRSGERGSGISVLAARHDDNNDEGAVSQTPRPYRSSEKITLEFVSDIQIMIDNDPSEAIKFISRDMWVFEFLISLKVHEDICYFSCKTGKGHFLSQVMKDKRKDCVAIQQTQAPFTTKHDFFFR